MKQNRGEGGNEVTGGKGVYIPTVRYNWYNQILLFSWLTPQQVKKAKKIPAPQREPGSRLNFSGRTGDYIS
jgi:hypothetical protein